MDTNNRETLMLQGSDTAPAPMQPQPVLPGNCPRKRSKLRNLFFLAVLAAVAILFWQDIQSFMRTVPDVKPRDVPPVTGLHPILAAKRAELITEAGNNGIVIRITDGFRSSEKQDALYRKGRSENGPIVTHVKGGDSYHNYGLAIDFALRTPDGNVIWDMKYDGNQNGKSDWIEVVSIAKQLGFSWGGDWVDFRDYPHLQMDFGYSIPELKRGERPATDNPERLFTRGSL